MVDGEGSRLPNDPINNDWLHASLENNISPFVHCKCFCSLPERVKQQVWCLDPVTMPIPPTPKMLSFFFYTF